MDQQNVPRITHGIARGDVTNQSTVIWSRPNAASMMNIKYDTNPDFTNSIQPMTLFWSITPQVIQAGKT